MDDFRTRATAGPAIASTVIASTVTEAVLPGVVDPDGIQVRTRPARPAGPGRVGPAMEAAGHRRISWQQTSSTARISRTGPAGPVSSSPGAGPAGRTRGAPPTPCAPRRPGAR
ncbi:hypothetical protein ACIRFH_20410 [Streptomyces sp. NPDC093586]|uniref:hypothetical protein n=1 Tax=Streptomyces sp. NPDC093586 TaxID=3366042 RepID=UPI0037FB7110